MQNIGMGLRYLFQLCPSETMTENYKKLNRNIWKWELFLYISYSEIKYWFRKFLYKNSTRKMKQTTYFSTQIEWIMNNDY